MRVVKAEAVEYITNNCPDIFLHGCNVQPDGMLSGVAKRLSFVWPSIVEAHKQYVKDKRAYDFSFAEGTWSHEKVTGRTRIFNMYTQFNGGPDFKLINWEMLMYRFNLYMLRILELDSAIQVAMVPIGCGIGGAEWDEVWKVMVEKLDPMVLDSITLITTDDVAPYMSAILNIAKKEEITKIETS